MTPPWRYVTSKQHYHFLAFAAVLFHAVSPLHAQLQWDCHWSHVASSVRGANGGKQVPEPGQLRAQLGHPRREPAVK